MHYNFLNSKTLLLPIKHVYLQCVYPQMHQYYNSAYQKPDGFTNGAKPLWILYHFGFGDKGGKIALLSKIAS